jgi:ATP:ADP antiporter, AAA family
MLRPFQRLLDLRPGELERGILLFAYLFLVISSFVVAKAVRDAMFLDQFGALLLPYADIAVAVLVGVWVSIYLRIAGRTTIRDLQFGSLVFFAVNCLVFWWLSKVTHGSWLTPVIYVWVGMFGVVAPAQVWTLANYVLTTREAKRLYGFIGSGATTGWIVGGYLTQVTVKRFGAEATLVGIAIALMISALVVSRIWRKRPIVDGSVTASRRVIGTSSIWTSVRLIATSPYLKAIAAVILLSSYTTAIAGWQFRAISSHSITGRNELAAFFGGFNFYAGIIAFCLQWLLTGRLLRRLGLAFALFVVPVGLTLGSIGLLTFRSLAAVVALRGIDQILRYSIDKPTVELLYLPVSAQETNQVKSFIDTVVWRLGDGLAGGTILLAASFGQMAAVQVTWVNLFLLGGWLGAAWVAQHLYVKNLQESIQTYRLDLERATTTGLDRQATVLLSQQLVGDDPTEVLYALRMLGAGNSHSTHPAVRGLLSHEDPEIRREAIRVLDEGADAGATGAVEKALYDPDLHVRTQALLYVAHHTQVDPLDRIEQIGDFADFSIRAAMVTFLSQPGQHENLDAARLLLDRMLQDDSTEARLEAARLLELLPDQFEDQIRTVLVSGSAEQVRLAIRAVGHLRKRRLVGRVIERLGDPALVEECTEALACFGDKVVGTLRDYLTDAEVALDIRREIPPVMLRVDTQASIDALTECVQESDPQIRFRVISALNKLRDQHPTWPFDDRLVVDLLRAEIMGHLRLYQILDSLGTALGDATAIAPTLREAVDKELERIFRLLKLIYPTKDFHSAYFGIQSTSAVIHDNALEFLENVLVPEFRALLLPLIDSQVPVVQRVELANRTLGTATMTPEMAVRSLLGSEDPWLRACSAYAIGELGLQTFKKDLERLAEDSDPLLRETARQALRKLRPH